jgi:hypothetical protein
MPKSVDPANLAKCGSEHANQVALFCWAGNNFKEYPSLRLMYAIPNGGERDNDKKTAMIRRANLKAEGVKAGILDVCLPVPIGIWHGLYIELKVGKNKPTDEQEWYIAELIKQGYGALWVIGWEAARDVILAYLNWKG